MIVDILVLIVIALSALIAFLRGFIREIFTIINVAGALVASYYGGAMLLPFMQGWLGVDPNAAAEEQQRLFDIIPYTIIAQALSYGAVFIVVIIILSIISHFLAETVKSIGLGAIDRTMGVMFGILRGVLLIGLLYLPVHISVNGTEHEKTIKEEWFDGSKTYTYIQATSDIIAGFVPEEARKAIERQVEDGNKPAEDKSGVRETLENLEILPKSGKAGEDETTKKGYTPEFRQEMDKLFEQKNDDEPKQQQ